MERSYRAANGIFAYALFLALDCAALTWEGARRWQAGASVPAFVLLSLAAICLICALALLWRWGRVRVVVTPDTLLVRGEMPPRRIYWADVDRVREIRGPSYQLSLRRLLPGPYFPHTLLRGETVLEVVARPGMRVIFRRALVDGYEALKQDVLRSISKTADIDLHSRWWRD
jgi:hypothetical protein